MHDHWILLLEDLNSNTVCHNHPPDNSPELMRIDENLLNDWTDALKEHDLLTMTLDGDDPMEFSRYTPKRIASSMHILWDGDSSSSDRVVHDIRKLVCTNMPIFKEHKGLLAPNLGNRRGKKCPKNRIKSKNREFDAKGRTHQNIRIGMRIQMFLKVMTSKVKKREEQKMRHCGACRMPLCFLFVSV